MEDTQHSYEEAMTRLLHDQLAALDVQPADVGKRAEQSIENQWYTTRVHFLIRMLKRNFDIGIGDGTITPWLVPGICPEARPQPQPIPSLEFLRPLGFCVELEIEPKELEKHEILKAIGLGAGSRIHPETHFPIILEHIRKEAREACGQDVELPELKPF
jgi:hypothetical protein